MTSYFMLNGLKIDLTVLPSADTLPYGPNELVRVSRPMLRKIIDTYPRGQHVAEFEKLEDALARAKRDGVNRSYRLPAGESKIASTAESPFAVARAWNAVRGNILSETKLRQKVNKALKKLEKEEEKLNVAVKKEQEAAAAAAASNARLKTVLGTLATLGAITNPVGLGTAAVMHGAAVGGPLAYSMLRQYPPASSLSRGALELANDNYQSALAIMRRKYNTKLPRTDMAPRPHSSGSGPRTRKKSKKRKKRKTRSRR